jgi:hypothetical protein
MHIPKAKIKSMNIWECSSLNSILLPLFGRFDWPILYPSLIRCLWNFSLFNYSRTKGWMQVAKEVMDLTWIWRCLFSFLESLGRHWLCIFSMWLLLDYTFVCWIVLLKLYASFSGRSQERVELVSKEGGKPLKASEVQVEEKNVQIN